MRDPTLFPATDMIEPSEDPFEAELLRQAPGILGQVEGARLLVVGGAGTIGSATLRTLFRFRPSRIVVVDLSENGLAELARDIRSTRWPEPLPKLEFVAIDYASPVMRQVLASGPFDHVLNFAAVKHVRSERSPATLVRMFEVNVVGLVRLLRDLSMATARTGRVFSVSTDKAADPVNLMGASKRVMEAVLLDERWTCGESGRTAARFANVAFSAGSLLESWTLRLQKGQPLACPADARRFMISRRQSGRLCALAAFALDGQVVGVPSDDAGVREWALIELAERFLRLHDLEAVHTGRENEARDSVAALRSEGRYPLLVTPLDTAGEKTAEVFVGIGEERVRGTVRVLDCVRPVPTDPTALDAVVDAVERMAAGQDTPDRDRLVAAIDALLPQMTHRPAAAHLDERM